MATLVMPIALFPFSVTFAGMESQTQPSNVTIITQSMETAVHHSAKSRKITIVQQALKFLPPFAR